VAEPGASVIPVDRPLVRRIRLTNVVVDVQYTNSDKAWNVESVPARRCALPLRLYRNLPIP